MISNETLERLRRQTLKLLLINAKPGTVRPRLRSHELTDEQKALIEKIEKTKVTILEHRKKESKLINRLVDSLENP